MIIDTHKLKQNKYEVDNDKANYILFLKEYSFIVCLHKPYINRHKQLSYPVKTILFNRSLEYNMDSLIKLSSEKGMRLKFLFVFKDLKAFPPDFKLNLINLGENYFIHMNIVQFVNWIKHNENDINNFLIVFNGFKDWSDIIQTLFVFGRIHFEGSNSSTRHIFDDLSIRLSEYLYLLSFNHVRKFEDLIVKDKSKLKPKLDLVNIDASNFKEEKEGTVLFFNNVYIKYKDYAIDMEKWINTYKLLSNDLYKNIKSENHSSTIDCNGSNKVSSTQKSEKFKTSQKRNYHMLRHVQIYNNNNNNNNNNNKLASYLAGLIEGYGTIIVPKRERSLKDKLNYSCIQLVFDSRDLALALMIQKNLGHGSISKKKGVNAYILTINNNEGIVLLVNLINGYMRTPKIYSLYKLIDWLNNKFNLFIEKKDIDKRDISLNAWLAGFIDADGHFSVRTSLYSKYPKIECKFELCQRQIDQNKQSNLNFLNLIAEFLLSTVKEIRINRSNPQYRIRTTSLKANIILVNYLNEYPLFSSKYLNYKDWVKVLDLFKKKEHYKLESIKAIIEIKSKMNNRRTEFNWDHLNKFYNLHE